MIAYICNGEKPDCKKTFCLYNGTGSCDHTTDERYAAHHDGDRYFTKVDDDLWYEEVIT